MQYFVVQKSTVEGLIENVNLMLEHGWKPLGGLAVASDQGYRYFCQALIRG